MRGCRAQEWLYALACSFDTPFSRCLCFGRHMLFRKCNTCACFLVLYSHIATGKIKQSSHCSLCNAWKDSEMSLCMHAGLFQRQGPTSCRAALWSRHCCTNPGNVRPCGPLENSIKLCKQSAAFKYSSAATAHIAC